MSLAGNLTTQARFVSGHNVLTRRATRRATRPLRPRAAAADGRAVRACSRTKLSPHKARVYTPSSFGLRYTPSYVPFAREPRGIKQIPTAVSTSHAMQVFPSTTTAVLQSVLVQDLAAYVFSTIGSLLWVYMFRELTKRQMFDQKLSRKLVHITSGTLFILSWVLYSHAAYARYLAASVPLINGIRLVALGTGLVRDDNAVNSISREGNPRELLGGPLYYVVAMSAVTAMFWRESAIGIAALSLMCGGDGLADIVGRRYGGKHKLPWNQSKTWAGSIAMFTGGVIFTVGFTFIFQHFGYMIVQDPMGMVRGVAIVSLIATIVESLPINKLIDDNISVPVGAILAGLFFL